MTTPPSRSFLFVRSGERICALALEHVVETLRPVRTEPLTGTPPFVSGVAILRGDPAPVVDLAAFLSGTPSGRVTRYVALRCGGRTAALAVDAVIGVGAARGDAPAPLLGPACAGTVAALGALDRELLLVLETARIVPEEAFAAVSPPDRPERAT